MGADLAHRANRLTDTNTPGSVIEVALRWIPITPDLNPNFVVRHRTAPALSRGVCQETKTAPRGLFCR
jgi:hypothetical protein